MDPDEMLEAILTDARAVLGVSDDVKEIEKAERILQLNEWLCKGGFLPAAWRVERTVDSESRYGL